MGQDVTDITVETTAVFADAARARAQVQGAGAPQRAHAHADIKEQLDMLLTPGYLRTTPPAWLAHFPRYLRGILARLEKLNYSPQKDEARTREARQPLEGYRSRAARLAERNLESTALTDFRFMIEEYRISLFAQELKTAYPVSKKRLEELWKSLGRG